MLHKNFKIYLVGGAVRDNLLGLKASDRDWVVVGATPKDLIKLGFKKIGKDLPIFLHPKTNEEYTLACVKRKTKNHHDNDQPYYIEPDVTLEEDLSRRDLTSNAIAQDEYGKLIDPFNGQKDIKNRILKHISNSFIEDPLRVLRVARFSAQLAEKNFKIANKTKKLMKKMSEQNKFKNITSERIWLETKKALQSSSPDLYFKTLYNCGAFSKIFLEANEPFELEKSSNKEKSNLFLNLKKASLITKDLSILFSVLCFNFKKNFFFQKKQFKNLNNIENAINLIKKMCYRANIPHRIKELAILTIKFYSSIKKIENLKEKKIIQLFNQIDGWRRPDRILQLASAFEINTYCNDLSIKNNNFICPQKNFFLKAFHVAKTVSGKNILKNINKKKINIKKEIENKRIKKLKKWKKLFLNNELF